MKARILGGTGVAICRVALGCGTFGGIGSPRHLIGAGLDRDAAQATMDEALALGINLFDTAHSYAGGAGERWIGEWLRAQTPDARASVCIATKVGNVVGDSGVAVDLTPRNIASQVAESVERLGLDRVDFCLAHAPDPATPIESTLEGFADVIERGLVAHVGMCNIDAVQLTAALEASTRLGLPRCEWVQNEYNLLQRADERELLALCAVHGLGYTPYSPMAGGVLSGKYRPDESPPPDSRLALRPEGHQPSRAVFDAVAKLALEARRRDCEPGALALAWVIGHPQVTAAVSGPSRTAEHLRLARQAMTIELDEASRNELGAWFAGSAAV